MKETRLIMGMPITVDVPDPHGDPHTLDLIFDYFVTIDSRFSPYKKDSEVSLFNRGQLPLQEMSSEFREILEKSEHTKQDTDGYFDITHDGVIDPSGLVKGWAIQHAAHLLIDHGITDFVIEAGGDIQIGSTPRDVGIRHPFEADKIVKVVRLLPTYGMATSGRQFRGDHIYDPHTGKLVHDVASLTIIAPSVYDADRYATAAFAMGADGIYFVEKREHLEGYMIDNAGIATYSSGWERYII